MNAIQLRVRIDEKIDRTRSARHTDRAYYNAINGAILKIVKDRVAPIRAQRNYSVQSSERIRDELYTIVTSATGSTSGGHIPRPADYFYYLLAYVTINGTQQYCRPTSYNELGPLKRNPHRRPSVTKPYVNENTTGIKVEFGTTGTLSTYELWYVKNPATVSIGEERDKITTGGALTNTVVYYVYEQAVYNGTTYYPGETITGTGATLTSGIVIINTKIVNPDLPDNMHEEICDKAAMLLSLNIEDYNKRMSINDEIERN